MTENVKKLFEILGVTPKNVDIYAEALTHRSYINENRSHPYPHNERLEFLGDAVLELIVTEHLFKLYPKEQEGKLTAYRASLVNGEMLGSIGTALGLEPCILLSRGESSDAQARARLLIVADAVEAVIGALYLDLGRDAAEVFITTHILTKIGGVIEGGLYTDAKSRLQEIAQERHSTTPRYEIMKEWGLDHERHFTAGVFIGDEFVADGEGVSKQEAQRNAAKKALEVKGW
jgi:ribonuclease-3